MSTNHNYAVLGVAAPGMKNILWCKAILVKSGSWPVLQGIFCTLSIREESLRWYCLAMSEANDCISPDLLAQGVGDSCHDLLISLLNSVEV